MGGRWHVSGVYVWQVPEWMLSIKKLKPKDRRKREMGAPQRHRISTVSGYDLKKRNRKRQLVKKTSQGKGSAKEDSS